MNLRFYKLMIVFGGAVFIAACSPTYTCGTFPESGCQPVSAAYEETNTGVADYRKEFYNGTSSGKSSLENSNEQDDEYAKDIVAKHAKPSILTDMAPGNPIIKERRVIRMLLNNWNDADNDLHSGEYIFMRIGDEEWVTR